MEPEQGQLLVFAAVGGELATVAVADESVGGVPVRDDAEPPWIAAEGLGRPRRAGIRPCRPVPRCAANLRKDRDVMTAGRLWCRTVPPRTLSRRCHGRFPGEPGVGSPGVSTVFSVATVAVVGLWVAGAYSKSPKALRTPPREGRAAAMMRSNRAARDGLKKTGHLGEAGVSSWRYLLQPGQALLIEALAPLRDDLAVQVQTGGDLVVAQPVVRSFAASRRLSRGNDAAGDAQVKKESVELRRGYYLAALRRSTGHPRLLEMTCCNRPPPPQLPSPGTSVLARSTTPAFALDRQCAETCDAPSS